MIILPEVSGKKVRIGITAGRSIGKAVQRNRAKRLLKAALHSFFSQPGMMLQTGWDILILARRPILDVKSQDVKTALIELFQRAKLCFNENDEC